MIMITIELQFYHNSGMCLWWRLHCFLTLVAELGDYEEELDLQHLESKKYVPNQECLHKKILRFHKRHR